MREKMEQNCGKLNVIRSFAGVSKDRQKGNFQKKWQRAKGPTNEVICLRQGIKF